MNWHEELVVEPTLGQAGNQFRASISDEWTSLQGAHGGIVAALALKAAEEVLAREGISAEASMRAATLGYVSGNVVGDIDIEVEIIRQGRALSTTHVRTSQNGKTTTVARFYHSPPWDGMEYSDVPAMPQRPSETINLYREGTKSHLNNVETHLHSSTAILAGADRAEWMAWSRPLHGGSLDSAWLLMFGDYFPPAVFAKATTPQRAVTIEYSIQVHSAAGNWVLGDDEYLTSRMHAFHSHDGFAVEDGWIYLPDGQLLATTRQTRLAG